MIITRKGNAVYNPVTKETSSVDEQILGKGIMSSIDDNAVNGTTVMAGDVNIMCVVNSRPNVNDSLLFGGKTYNIVNVRECNPDGNCVIYYEIQGR